MWDWRRARLQERFGELEGFFRTGERPRNIYGKRIEDGIWDGKSYMYRRGESLEDYLKTAAESGLSNVLYVAGDGLAVQAFNVKTGQCDQIPMSEYLGSEE